MTVTNSLSDRMKFYERLSGSEDVLMPLIPTVGRFDGNCFHKFCKGLKRPFDENFKNLMIETTKYIAKETNALIGYISSDEISLIWNTDEFDAEIYRAGRIFKMVSIIASKISVYFNSRLKDFLPEKEGLLPVFDGRVWNVPNKEEAVNSILWREIDSYRNSISMAAQSVYSHNELMNKNCDEMQEMLFKKGINFNDYPTSFKRGTYIQRKKINRKYNFDELDKLPLKHEARSNPNLIVERTEFVVLDMPPISKVTNRIEVVFDGADPKME